MVGIERESVVRYSLCAGAVRQCFAVYLIFFFAGMSATVALAAIDPAMARTMAALEDPDWHVREEAARELGEAGLSDRSIVEALVVSLDDDNSRVRRAAALALGAIGPKASRSLPALVARFEDIDEGVIAAAASGVGNMGSRASRHVDELRALLAHPDERVQVAAAAALGKMGRRAGDSMADLGAQLDDPDASVRIAAAEALGRMGRQAEGQSSLLVQALQDDDPAVRAAASRALVSIGEDAVPGLIRALSKGDPVFLREVISTLGDMGSMAVPKLVTSLHGQRNELLERRYAALALARIGDADRRVIPALAESLGDDNPDVRIAALEALGHAGNAAREELSGVIDLAVEQREPVAVREAALAAMASIAPADEAVKATLVDAVSDGNPGIYEAAVAGLIAVRRQTALSDSVEALSSQLRSGASSERMAAARQLGEMGSFAVAAVPALDAVLADRGNSIALRAAAATSLGMIGPEAESAVPELIRTLEEADVQLRDAAVVALDRIGPQTQTIPALLEAMRLGSLDTQAAAAQKVRDFARARLETWQHLLAQSDAPVMRNWLARHEALYSVSPETTSIGPWGGDVEGPDYFDVMGGRAAIRESMQLELIANPVTGTAEARTVAVDDVDAVTVRSHPFEDMLEASKEPVRRVPLAELVPPDRAFAWFRDIDALRRTFAGGANQFLRFESALAVKSVEYDLEQRYLERLGLTRDAMSQVEALSAIEDLAVIVPDLFLVDGTDITIIANLRSAQLTQAVLGLLGLTRGVGAEPAARELENGEQVAWAIRGDRLFVSSNPAELRSVLALNAEAGEGSLGQSDEFLYMQQQLGIEQNTDAYIYFSDAFIRRLVSPEVKIAQLRRMQARAEMEMLVSAAMLYLLDGNRHIPSKEQLIRHRYLPSYFGSRDYAIDQRLVATSEQHGTIAKMRPLSANPVLNVSQRERDAYSRFVADYTNYWSQFFDPIAMRLDQVGDDTHELTTFILPLLDSDLYAEVKDALANNETGQRLRIPILTPTPSMMVSANLSDDLRIDLSRQLTGMLVRYTAVNPEIFDSIGSAVHLAVRDSTPIVALGSGDIWGALDREMLRMSGFESMLPFLLSVATQPSTVLIELTDPERVRQFLSDAVALQADGSGEGELHKLQGREAWIYTLNIVDIVQIHLRIEIKEGYLMISNLPWSTQVGIDGLEETALNGATMHVNLDEIEHQLPALHTKIFANYRAAAVDGMGYPYPLMLSGASKTVSDALARHLEIFGFRPVHPWRGQWNWRESYLTSSEFGSASYPVQPPYDAGDRDFGLFPALSMLGVSMQLEDTGLRATIRWRQR